MKTIRIKDRPVLFLDSGIGGIPYCRHFLERNPDQSIVYLADREHFPYGGRKKEELAGILIRLTEQAIKAFNPKIAILACNTATLASISQLRKRFPSLPFVGTEPAIKPAALASKTGKIGVLGTELTIREPYIRELAARHGSCEIIGIAAPELVKLIETRLDSASAEEKKAMVRDYLNRFRTAGTDAIVLGCTHFLFLLEEFRQEAAPDINIFESINGISQRIESLLAESFPQEQKPEITKEAVQNRLLLTGRPAPENSWVNWADRLGFKLSLLEET